MKRSRLAAALTAASIATLTLGVGATPAFAKWTVHNSNDVTLITAPPGGTEQQTCADRLLGTTGWSTFVAPDVPAPDPLPAGAFTGVNYEVWKPPPGFTSMNEGQEVLADDGFTILGYTFFDANGNESSATKVKAFTTAQRTALATPIPINDGAPTGDVYVFTTAPIDEAMSGVVPGDVVGLKPTGGATFLNLTAVNCNPVADSLDLDVFVRSAHGRTLVFSAGPATLTSGNYVIDPATGHVTSITGTGTILNTLGGVATVTFNVTYRPAALKYRGSVDISDPGFAAHIGVQAGRSGVVQSGDLVSGTLRGIKAQSTPQKCFVVAFQIDDLG